MNASKKTIFYSDDLNEDFSGIKRSAKIIDEKYKYIHTNIFWKFFTFIIYWVVMVPVAFFYMQLKFGLKFKNKKILKKYRKTGYFLYGNHTQVSDAYIQALLAWPKKHYVIASPENVSMKGTEKIMLMFGAMPLPSTFGGYKKFISALGTYCKQNKSIVIYPEAHIWPYYTGIRNFPSASFCYPNKFDKPVFSFTAVYKKRRIRKIPKIIVKVDGPFFADKTLPVKEAEKQLRDLVYDSMVAASRESNCEYIKYVYKEKQDDTSETNSSPKTKEDETND